MCSSQYIDQCRVKTFKVATTQNLLKKLFAKTFEKYKKWLASLWVERFEAAGVNYSTVTVWGCQEMFIAKPWVGIKAVKKGDQSVSSHFQVSCKFFQDCLEKTIKSTF